MAETTEKEIEKILRRIIIFDEDFKARVLEKIKAGIGAGGLEKIKSLLLDAESWQKTVVIRILKQNPSFYDRVMKERRQIDRDIVAAYSGSASGKDEKEINKTLSKISNYDSQ